MKRSATGLLFYWAIVTTVVAALAGSAPRASAAISDCIDASCRISAGNARGTGCVFERSQGYVYVLTNAHVVGAHATVRCEFWRNGHMSAPITGRVIARVDSDQCDAAIVALPVSAFGGLFPKVVPVAKRDYVTRPGETIVSVGCANGRWSTGWKGHVLGYRGFDMHFVPPPADGRSGSAVFDADGKQIVGLIRARTVDGRQGIACSVQALYRAFGGAGAEQEAQCPGGVCPSPENRLLPYRQQQEYNQRLGGIWPTTPSPTPALDLSETNRKLDQIADVLEQIRSAGEPAVPLTPLKPAADGEIQQRLDDAEKAAEEVKQQAGNLQEGLTGLHGLVQKLAGDVETLPNRLRARIDKVKDEGAETVGEVARAYTKDLLSEKLAGGKLGLTAGKILGGALGLSGPLAAAVALAAWLVSRRIGRKIESGDPLLATRLYDRLADRIDELRDRIASTATSEPARKR